jgi:hypothetical protein
MYPLIRLPLAAISLLILTAMLPVNSMVSVPAPIPHLAKEATAVLHSPAEINEKYAAWELGKEGISRDLFLYAMKGYANMVKKYQLLKSNIISIADFSKPSTEKRLYVIDITTGRILYKTLVAHGRNSGQLYASNFSNKEASYTSSLGFYITEGTYNGKNGYSLKLKGCEQKFNDNASDRAIVMHGADYVSEQFIKQNGFLGRSHGCPALPVAFAQKIIDTIKNGSCLFIYAPSKKYLLKSAILNG